MTKKENIRIGVYLTNIRRENVTPPPPGSTQATNQPGNHVMRDVIIRDSISLETLRKWTRRNKSNKPIHISNHTTRRHDNHSDILPLGPTDVLSLPTQSRSHVIGKKETNNSNSLSLDFVPATMDFSQ